jgi:hypothetical protein
MPEQWYGTQRWRNRSKHQLRAFPLCKMCLDKGVVVPATVSDHVIPHHGDEVLFWFGELQSLCAHHHSSSKAEQEKRGYSREIGRDGWPTDPQHPANRGPTTSRRQG